MGGRAGQLPETLLKTYSEATLKRLREEDRLIEPTREGAMYSYKQYLSESSGERQEDDVWTDINMINPVAKERYEQKLWMRDLMMGVAYPPVER